MNPVHSRLTRHEHRQAKRRCREVGHTWFYDADTVYITTPDGQRFRQVTTTAICGVCGKQRRPVPGPRIPLAAAG